MGVDIVHLIRCDTGVLRTAMLHCLGGAAAVRAGGQSCDRRHNWHRSPPAPCRSWRPALGVGDSSSSKMPAPLAQDKAAALLSKGMEARLGSSLWLRAFMGGEAADGQRRYGGFRAAAEHHIGITVPDIVEGIAHGVGAAGAGSHRAGAHAPETRRGWRSGRQPCCRCRWGYRRERPGPSPSLPRSCSASVMERPPMPLETMTPQRSASASSRVKFASAMAAMALTTANWVKTAHPLGSPAWAGSFRGRNPLPRRPALPSWQASNWVMGRDAASAVLDGLPALHRGKAHGRDRSQAGNDDSASFHKIPPIFQTKWCPPNGILLGHGRPGGHAGRAGQGCLVYMDMPPSTAMPDLAGDVSGLIAGQEGHGPGPSSGAPRRLHGDGGQSGVPWPRRSWRRSYRWR